MAENEDTNWTQDDYVACFKEGWSLFHRDDGGVQIMALDDPDGVAADFGFAPFAGNRFASDDEAIAFVEKRAAEGGDRAAHALATANRRNPAMSKELRKKVRRAVANEMGYTVRQTQIDAALTANENQTDAELRILHKERTAIFRANGGRGVELADEIDELAIALAARRAVTVHLKRKKSK